MIARMVEKRVEGALSRYPAVALLGARQVGKTTLARELVARHGGLYLDLEDPGDRRLLTDPVAFLGEHAGRLVVIDEIQRLPELFSSLRVAIDRNRERGHRHRQFLLLGSGSMELVRQTQSLAGRVAHMGMGGLNALEVGGGEKEVRRLWLRGGFPDAYLSASDGEAMDYLRNLSVTYLERDVQLAGHRIPSERLGRMWGMLAPNQGEPANASRRAANLEVTGRTVRHNVDVLAGLLVVRRLQPWHSNEGKRLVKAPRQYVRDSGILHSLLGIRDRRELLSAPVVGKSWEGFVVENLHSVMPDSARAWYYRTAAGAEIDLVIEFSRSEVWAVEVWLGSAPKAPRHFGRTCDDVGATKRFVVHGGDREFPLGEGVRAVPLAAMMEKVASVGGDLS